MTRHELSANFEWWLYPHEPADDCDGAYRADGFDDELVAGLEAEAGRPLTERELSDAFDYFPAAFHRGDNWSCPLWKVDYNPTWHLTTPEDDDDNIFFPESLERQVERGKDELAAKLAQALRSQGGLVAAPAEATMQGEFAFMDAGTHDAMRVPASGHLAGAEESADIAIGIAYTGSLTISHPLRPRTASGFDVAMCGGLSRPAAGALRAKGLATWLSLRSKPDHDADLASLAADIEQIGDAQLRASLRHELGRIRALARARTPHLAQARVRIVRPPTPPLTLQVEAAGGKTGRYTPLD